MDNNPIQPTPTGTPQAAQPAPNMMQQPAEGGNNKMVVWLIVGLVVIVLLVGGIYFYMSSQQKSTSQTAQQETAIPSKGEDLENDLNAVNISDVDSDFSSVDQDLKSL